MARELTDDEKTLAHEMLNRARTAQGQIEGWTQDQLDRLSQAMTATQRKALGLA